MYPRYYKKKHHYKKNVCNTEDSFLELVGEKKSAEYVRRCSDPDPRQYLFLLRIFPPKLWAISVRCARNMCLVCSAFLYIPCKLGYVIWQPSFYEKNLFFTFIKVFYESKPPILPGEKYLKVGNTASWFMCNKMIIKSSIEIAQHWIIRSGEKMPVKTSSIISQIAVPSVMPNFMELLYVLHTWLLWSKSCEVPIHHVTKAEGREPNVIQWMSYTLSADKGSLAESIWTYKGSTEMIDKGTLVELLLSIYTLVKTSSEMSYQNILCTQHSFN